MKQKLIALWEEIRRISRDTTPRYAFAAAPATGDSGAHLWLAIALLLMAAGILLAWWGVR